MRTKQRILQISKTRLLTFGLAIFFNILLAGSVCGTFAWYTYATRTGFEKQYHGTTVGDMGTLQGGLVSDVELPDFLDYDLAEDKTTLEEENKIIYWCKEKIEARTINYVIGNNGSSTTKVDPVTTGSNDIVSPDDFHLFKNPSFLSDYSLDDQSYAKTSSYVYIPFVFRYEDPDSIGTYTPNKPIYFTSCDIEMSENSYGREMYKAGRLYVSNRTTGYIINPTATSNGFDKVGGILDLNGDGFYDYDDDMKEHIYGQSISSRYLDDPTPIDGTIPEEERTSFVANHKQGVYALDEETYESEIVSYENMDSFMNKSKSVTVTDENYHNLGILDFYIYIEGWDLHVINQNAGAGFNMDIKFEVNV